MAAAFKPVNTPMTPEPEGDDSAMLVSPSTPKPNQQPTQPPAAMPTTPAPMPVAAPVPATTMDNAVTPTTATFAGGALASQKPLPSSPFLDAVQIPESAEKLPRRENSMHSRKSRDSEDVDMDGDSDGETGGVDGGAGSDDESVNDDGTRSNRKKKSLRFWCTDYPPCNLSFTRSEHLARHIRKHTGERPFQCHCSRRFSRLDNLRQHAQTVHVNEDIPMDSLAATGTRFQRQIRTDRVRVAPGRVRASTAESIGSPVRRHGKSLSTSSIAALSPGPGGYSIAEDIVRREEAMIQEAARRDEVALARQRPPPLVMASQFRREPWSDASENQFSYRPPSPTDYSTPTSATFSTSQDSPRWGSGVASPTSSYSRPQSMHALGSRTPGRRLSVPSGGNPFQCPPGVSPSHLSFRVPGPLNSSNSGALPSSAWSRRESTTSTTDDWRRRTWHPDSREFSAGGNRLSSAISSLRNPPPPAYRLPGIQSFISMEGRPLTPPRPRVPTYTPMSIDPEAPRLPALNLGGNSPADDRRSGQQYDTGLDHTLTRLEIAPSSPPQSWANETNQAVQARVDRAIQPTVRFQSDAHAVRMPPETNPSLGYSRGHQHTVSAPVSTLSFSTPREMKRHAWYNGPASPPLSGGDQQSAERVSRVDRMVHPNLTHGFSGFPSRTPQISDEQPTAIRDEQDERDERDSGPNFGRLQALVAAATSEGSTARAY